MKPRDLTYGIFSLVLLYVFFYQLVYAMFNNVVVGWSALFLTVLLTFSLLTCPLIYNSESFKKVFGK